MDAITGTWKMDKSNIGEAEAFLQSVGMPADLTKKIVSRDYLLTYKVSGNTLNINVKVTNDPSLTEKNYVVEMGKEIETETIDNDKTKFLFKFEGGKFVEEHHDLVRGGVYHITREINGDVMTVKTTMNDKNLSQQWKRC